MRIIVTGLALAAIFIAGFWESNMWVYIATTVLVVVTVLLWSAELKDVLLNGGTGNAEALQEPLQAPLSSFGISDVREVQNEGAKIENDANGFDDDVQVRTHMPAVSVAKPIVPKSRKDKLIQSFLDMVLADFEGHSALMMRYDPKDETVVLRGFSGDKAVSVVLNEASPACDAIIKQVSPVDAFTLIDVERPEDFATAIAGYKMPSKVTQLMVALIPDLTVPSWYLLIDWCKKEDDDDTEIPFEHLTKYGHLFAELFTPPKEVAPPPPTRLQVIEEEMIRSREREHDLALALFYIDDAERIAGLGKQSIKIYDKWLHERLQDSIDFGSRIEPFGELMWGVFYYGSTEHVIRWLGDVHSTLIEYKDDVPGGAVSIGVAMLQDRHNDPADFREDAMLALEKAYDAGEPVVFE